MELKLENTIDNNNNEFLDYLMEKYDNDSNRLISNLILFKKY